MEYQYEFFIESGANHTFNYQETFDIRDYFPEDVWLSMTELEQETALDEIANEIAFNSYVNFGVSKVQ